MGKVEFVNQVDKRPILGASSSAPSSCSSSSSAPACKAPKAPQDTYEKAPAKCEKEPAKVVPPAPEQAPIKGVASSASSCTSSSCDDAKAPAGCEQQAAQGLYPDSFRSRINKQIVDAEHFSWFGHHKVHKDLKALARQLIKSGGSEAQFDAILEPFKLSHRKAIIEAEAQAQLSQQQQAEGQAEQQAGAVCIVSVPGGGIYQWARAVHSETHGWMWKGCERATAANLVRSTCVLIEDAENHEPADHRRRLAHQFNRLKVHLRHLTRTNHKAGVPGKGEATSSSAAKVPAKAPEAQAQCEALAQQQQCEAQAQCEAPAPAQQQCEAQAPAEQAAQAPAKQAAPAKKGFFKKLLRR